MSSTTSVVSVANTLMAWPTPAGTMMALALIRPSREFSVATTGRGCPVGHAVRYPREPCGTTDTFSEYAAAVVGIRQGPLGMAKSGDPCLGVGGPPKGPLTHLVSTTRQGVTATNRKGVWAPDG